MLISISHLSETVYSIIVFCITVCRLLSSVISQPTLFISISNFYVSLCLSKYKKRKYFECWSYSTVSTQSAHTRLSDQPDRDCRLALPSARPTVTFPATEHHHFVASTKLHRFVTEVCVCEQLAHSHHNFSPESWLHIPSRRSGERPR